MSDEEERKAQAKAIVDEFMERIYTEIGKGLLKKLFWIVLILILGAGVATGLIKLPHL